MWTFASTHTILHAPDGEFLSLIDPPPTYAQITETCRNIGAWPILVGDEEKGERDTMISSPIILYDYPKIAPESPGDLFDSAGIDEGPTRRTMTVTDTEKREMRGGDEEARKSLERTRTPPVVTPSPRRTLGGSKPQASPAKAPPPDSRAQKFVKR
jgi:hydrogenase maturation protease